MFFTATFALFAARARRACVCASLLAAFACGAAAQDQQQQPAPAPQTSPATFPLPPVPEDVNTLPPLPLRIPPTKCIQPAPIARWQDYQGPQAKIVAIFGRRLQRQSVRPLHYEPGVPLCTFSVKDKFHLFVWNTVDPLTFLEAGFNAGISQAENNDPTFGQEAGGYGKRYGAALADQASFQFFKSFAYPSLFSEDPRYYRLGRGTKGERILHALGHIFIAYNVDGTSMPNYSEWLGTTTTVVLSNTYHPGNRRGFDPAAERVGYNMANDEAVNILHEFWPEIARKFKLPFHGEGESAH